MNPLSIAKAPLWVAGVFGSDKSFADNPVLGSARLNRMGLHVRRVKTAAALADWRRRRLARLVSPEDRAAYDRDGIVVRRDFLDPAEFQALRAEVYGRDFAAREHRQGQAVERMIALGPDVLADKPALKRYVENASLRGLARYASSRGGELVFYLQTVIADPSRDAADPQTSFHSDTFHSTIKAWYFLDEVREDEGPFLYVPGSHRLTPERLDWEYRQSLAARAHANRHHAVGSFRITAEEIRALGYGDPMRLAAPANTLVIADTFGYHARAASPKHTVRVAIHTFSRRNPFLPWAGLDPLGLPGVRGRALDLHFKAHDLARRAAGKGPVMRPVGMTRVDAPSHI